MLKVFMFYKRNEGGLVKYPQNSSIGISNQKEMFVQCFVSDHIPWHKKLWNKIKYMFTSKKKLLSKLPKDEPCPTYNIPR